MKKRLLSCLLCALVLSSLSAQNRGASLMAAASEHLGTQAVVGKQYALFIGIASYRQWPALKKPVADAREIWKNYFAVRNEDLIIRRY